MNATLLLLGWIYLLFCHTSHAVVKELMEQKLEAKGVVKNGSMAYYDTENATWKFSVNLRVPQELNDNKINLLVELTEEGEHQENYVFDCKPKSREPFNSRKRFKISTMSFEKFDEVNTIITFDHVYSGNYTLVIIRCKDLSGQSCASDQKDRATYNNLPVVTNLNKVDVDCMNITVRAVEGEGGIDVHFSVNYSTNQPLLEFKKFQVEISQRFKILGNEITNDNNVIFSSTNLAKVNRCSQGKNSNTTLCSNYYTFDVTIRPHDTRCNYPSQVYKTSKRPCIRHITTEINISSKAGIRNEDRNIYVSSPLNYIWIPLLIVTLTTCVAMLRYLRRKRGENQQQNFTMASTFSDVQQTYPDSRKILLVYDMIDEVMKARASILRNQLITHGILTVYDSCDPQQEEIINTMGPVHWFNAHLNNSDVSVVIIQSSGFTRCFEEIMRVDRVNDIVSEQNDLLLFVLHQLLFITSVSSKSKYDRIFVTTYSDFECTVQNYLTPYRCYILPEHFDLLISEIH